MNGFAGPVPGFVFKSIQIVDNEEQDILQYFEECIAFMKQAKNVLVICS